jgi:hypothetical protein
MSFLPAVIQRFTKENTPANDANEDKIAEPAPKRYCATQSRKGSTYLHHDSTIKAVLTQLAIQEGPTEASRRSC